MDIAPRFPPRRHLHVTIQRASLVSFSTYNRGTTNEFLCHSCDVQFIDLFIAPHSPSLSHTHVHTNQKDRVFSVIEDFVTGKDLSGACTLIEEP